MTALQKVAERKRLKPRRDPYFAVLSRGRALGFRKLTSDTAGTWIARWRDSDTGRQHRKQLGPLDTLPANERYRAATRAAEKWFEHLEVGGSHQSLTIADACARYVEHLRAGKGDKAALDVQQRFARHVLDDARFADQNLAHLKRQAVAAWRRRLQNKPTNTGAERSDSALNRDLTALRAALNLAHADGLAMATTAWDQALLPIKGADRRRDLYLDREQRRALIEHAPADLALLVRAQCAVPIRPGAMALLNAGDYEPRLRALTVPADKAGAHRRIVLPDATAALFAEAARDKLPAAPLFSRADGQRWNKDSWKHPLKAAAKAADLPPQTTMYSLRHSTISDLVHGGLDLLTVAQISGTSVQMVQDHYGHLRSTVAATALEALAL